MLNIYNLKSKAYASLDHVFTKYPTAVDSTSVLKTEVETFRSKLIGIRGFKVPETAETMPLTQTKAALFEEVTLNAEIERNATLLYADDNNLPVLMGKMPRSYTDLTRGTEEERFRRCDALHNEAKSLGALLKPYGCDADVFSLMDTKLPLLRSALNATRDAIDDRVEQREGFEEKFKDMDSLLKKRLDRAVRTRAKEYPAFVSAYFDARVLPKSGVRSSSEEAEEMATATPKEVTPVTEQLQNAIHELNLRENGAAVG